MRACVLVAVLAAAPALADEAKGRAIALFEQGIAAYKAGNYEQACAALRESNELQADSGTRGSLARCYEKLGKLTSAWKLWVDLSTTAPKQLQPDAAANAAKLEPRLPKYVLRIFEAPPGLTITLDGARVDTAPGVPVPLDPGAHKLEVKADAFEPWTHELMAQESRTIEITVPRLAPRASIGTRRPDPIDKPASKSSRKLIGVAVIGVGGALVVGGTTFGVIAKSRNDDAKELCGGDIDACDAMRVGAAQDKVDSARSAGMLSTIGFVAGGVAVVTGVVLYVTAPKRQRLTIVPTAGDGSAGIIVTGGF